MLAFAAALALVPRPARAVLDVENNGPTLMAGAFAMRVTNIGSIGNPFYEQGLSFDPSFEYPRGSGNEGLKHADLWVGARVPSTRALRVSGGPLMEWRPTLDPEDRVRSVYGGGLGTQAYIDDDGDGRIDEEFLNGRDDDGDGEVDEDLGVTGAQELDAEYVDDRPEAIAFGYGGGEQHVPLHLSVQQKAFTWSVPGYDRIAGLHFAVTNHGTETLEDVRFGLLADLDSRGPGDGLGHINDKVAFQHYEIPYNDGLSFITDIDLAPYGADYQIPYSKSCSGMLTGDWPVVVDGAPNSGLPAFGVIPLDHTTDVLAKMEQVQLVDNRVEPWVRGPADVSFHYSIYANDLPAGEGGLPIVDADRYAAMEGSYPGPRDLGAMHDWVVLVSTGPLARMLPGQTFEFDLALVCGPTPDSVGTSMGLAALTQRGTWINALADTLPAAFNVEKLGKSGWSGHETCFEAPLDLDIQVDPHCHHKFVIPKENGAPNYSTPMLHGACMWIDADCDACTGFNGNETRARWADPAGVPPAPDYRVVPGDRAATVEWNNTPEVFLRAPRNGATQQAVKFTGYNVYRLSDWRRRGLLPGPEQFQLVASFGTDTLQGQHPLASATDTTLDYERLLYGAKEYPIGRYRWTDTHALNGFDYLYVVTTVGERALKVTPKFSTVQRFESPIVSSLDSLASPRAAAAAAGSRVWVTPNPYRGEVEWNRQPIAGDTFGRHLDFMGLPRARSTIRVYTLAGDLVQTLAHDGTTGNGEQRWNLISRNGQDVVSGIYLFTVESPLGHQVGRFVVIR